MKILVTGAGGMLGSEILRTYGDYGVEVIGLTHHDLDICDKEAMNQALIKHKPDIVINCAGIIKSRDYDTFTYYKVNTEGPKLIASLCDENNVKMVHISTDCVFTGDRPHTEHDIPDALDVYGRSKADGEVSTDNHLTLRMSFVGMGDRGLVSWLQNQTESVEGYMGFQWNGMTVNYAAKNILIAILRNLTGIVHICGEDTTKYHVLCQLNDALKLNLRVIPAGYPVIDRRLRTMYYHNFDTPPINKQIKEMVSDYCCDPCRS